MAYDLVVKNGLVVDPANELHAQVDIGVEGGRVAAVAPELGGSDNIVDAAGLLVMPGGIDMHTHCARDLCSYHMVAATGITTTIDFSGPLVQVLDGMQGGHACGLNVGVLETVRPEMGGGPDLSTATVDAVLERAMAEGALGLKLLGGSWPLTPKASAYVIEAANRAEAMIGVHSGTTENRSNILGMRESVELGGEYAYILAHISAYCRGMVRPYLEELAEAFALLRSHPRIVSESHLAEINACYGTIKGGEICDKITENCLQLFGYERTEPGLEQAMLDGLVKVYRPVGLGIDLLTGTAARDYWREQGTDVRMGFPANLATAATACCLERRARGGDFLIPIASTDGGSIPRNDLIFRVLHLHHMGYLTLEEVVGKVSRSPALAFGLLDKGHLGVGADADITLVDLPRSRPVLSIARGEIIMRDGVPLPGPGCVLTTALGAAACRRRAVRHQVVDPKNSWLYRQ